MDEELFGICWSVACTGFPCGICFLALQGSGYSCSNVLQEFETFRCVSLSNYGVKYGPTGSSV